jgi:hypothetical protein
VETDRAGGGVLREIRGGVAQAKCGAHGGVPSSVLNTLWGALAGEPTNK